MEFIVLLDMNLLAVFDVLMAERSVSRAALKLRLTQSAVSHSLAKLRSQLGDPLLVRGPGGMEPTPFALSMAGRLRPLLEELEGLASPPKPFAPAHATKALTIGLSDYVAFVLLPPLVRRLRSEAPGVRLVVRNTTSLSGAAMVEAGEVDLAVGYFPDPPKRLERLPLFREEFLCAARWGHPAFQGPLTPEIYQGQDHLNVSLGGEAQGFIDGALAEAGIRRRISVTAGHFLMVPFLLGGSDLVATEPARMLKALAAPLGLALRPPPLQLPGFAIDLLRLRRTAGDQALLWLADIMMGLCKESL